jgi:hypothetical protein
MDLRRIAIRVANVQFETYGIVSAYQRGADKHENEHRHELLKEEVSKMGLQHGEFLGRWEGERERALAVKGVAPEVLEELGRKYGQDAVVYVAPGCRKLIRLRA